MWLIGDYILAVSMMLNGSMALAYAYDGNQVILKSVEF
jgi:hypothetical protein